MYSSSTKTLTDLPAINNKQRSYCKFTFMQKLYLNSDSDSHLVIFYDKQTNN